MPRLPKLGTEIFMAVLDQDASAVAVLTPGLTVAWCNTACRRLLGLLETADDTFGAVEVFDAASVAIGTLGAVIGGQAPPLHDRLLGLRSAVSGQTIWKQVGTRAERTPDGTLRWLAVTMADAAPEPSNAQFPLRASADNWRRIVDNTPVGICITDHRGVFEFVNPAYLAFYGYGRDELIGQHFTLVVPPRFRDLLSDAHDRFIAGAGEIRGEWTVMDRSGRERSILADATRIVDQQGSPKKVTFIIDISQRKQLEDELAANAKLLETLSMADPLTGLYNRRHADTVLERETARAHRDGRPMCIGLIDIDRFKSINDRFGHPTGDDVLVAASTALRAAFRDTDTLARYGGEEFLVILPDAQATRVVAALRHARDLVVERCTALLPEPVTFSAGVVDLQPDDTARTLLVRADRLLYNAKAAGRDRIVAGDAVPADP